MTDHMYTVKVYVAFGYFKYSVMSMASAVEHAQTIMSSGVYRRVTGQGDLELHKVCKVKVCGANLDTEYPDEFCRT